MPPERCGAYDCEVGKGLPTYSRGEKRPRITNSSLRTFNSAQSESQRRTRWTHLHY